jgi:hypothetical protein
MVKPGIGIGAVCLLALAALATTAAPTEAASQRPKPLVKMLAPHEDGIVQGRTVTVRVRLAPGARLRSAKLNGAGVKRLLHRRGSRLLVARIDKRRVRALRRGRNFLHLVVRRGRRRALRTIGFTLVRPLRQLVRRFNAGYSRGNGLRIAMKLSRLHAKVRVTLNGRDLSGQFANELSARPKARLGADEGLRHGHNVLRVRVTHHSGLIRRFRRDFFVPRATTIAGAERDRSVPAGSAVTLNGGASRVSLRADGSRKKGGLSFSWQVLRSPRGSHPKLTASHSKQPRLRTDRPGRYVVRLATTMRSETSGGQASTSADEVEVVGEPQPLVPVDTGATIGEARGFAVGVTRECEGAAAAAQPCFYPTPGAGEDLQVLVLDRTTLEPISNKSYSSSELGAFATAMEELNENDGLPNTAPKWETGKLVMVALREGSLGESEALARGLGSFNVSSEGGEAQPLKGLGEAPFSLIAVPGTLEGKAAVNYGGVQIAAPDGTKGAAGAISGFLKVVSDTPGEEEGEGGASEFTRAFAWPDSIPYDTRYQPPESSGEPESVRIGEATLPILPSGEPADRDGIAVFIFNPIDPEGTLERNAFVTNANGAGTDSGLDWSMLSSKLKYAIEERLGIALVSNGDIGGFATEPDASYFPALERQLELLGANPDTFGRAVRRDGTYSMLSAGERPGEPNIPGQIRAAYSASSVMAEGNKEGSKLKVGPGRLTGLLQRASYGAVFPSSGDPGGSEPEPELLQTIYLKQSPWLLTPAPEAATASCQQLAFAYLTQAIGISSAAELPLWSGADSSACAGIDHTGESGTRSADSLAGDSCATTEAAATGANPANVRTASLRMRSRYTDLAQVFGEGQISGVVYPAAGAPFTEADLLCAKNQMIDEVEARSQAIALVEQLGKVQYESEGRVVTELQVIAAEVEALMLSKLKKEIENSGRATAAFWAGFALQTLGSTAKLAAAVSGSGTTTATALRIVGQAASLGQGATSLIQAKEGNPVTLTDAYLLLASQLHQEAVKIEAQIEEVLAAQQQGALLSEAALLSDPGRLAAVDAKASGAWVVTPEAQLKAQNIYLYRVRQLAYQDFWPQAYSGARLKYSGICAKGFSACWQDGEWREPEGGPPVAGTSLVRAGQGRCLNNNYFEGAASGSPGGIGEGNEFQPAATPSPNGQSPPSYLDYLMASTSELKNGKVSLAGLNTIQFFFEQPSDSAQQPSGSAPPGFYAPEFWWQNLDLKTQVHCNGESGKLAVEKIDGAYAEVEANAVWPTPPRPFCVERTVSGKKRATCTYDQGYFNESTLNLASLVSGLGGDLEKSGVWIYAFGGPGANGASHGGSGGSGGLARGYYDSVDSFTSALGTSAIRYYLGAAGANKDGAGGASTLVAVGNVSSSAESPCVVADANGIEPGGETVSIAGFHSGSGEACTQNVVLLAGGGGGGGHGSSEGEPGKAGGRGGEALATTRSMVAAGADGKANKNGHRGRGAFNGAGGKGGEGSGKSGVEGIGGIGGSAGGSDNAMWFNTGPFYDAEALGVGGADGSGKGGHGGGGGGGFGGGGGGGDGGNTSTKSYGGGGGGGGGSFAYRGDAPPTENVPKIEAPGNVGALVIVIELG